MVGSARTDHLGLRLLEKRRDRIFVFLGRVFQVRVILFCPDRRRAGVPCFNLPLVGIGGLDHGIVLYYHVGRFFLSGSRVERLSGGAMVAT